MQSQVIFTLVLSALVLKDTPSVAQRIGVLVSAIGVALLIWNFKDSPTIIGLFFVLAGALCSGITKIVMKKAGNYDTFRLMIWMSIVPPIPLLLLSLIFETDQLQSLLNVTYRGVGAVFFNAFISTILGFGLLGYLLKKYSPNQIAPYGFLVPVFGLGPGYIILNETLDANSVIACCLIMLGLVYPKYGAPLFERRITGRRD